MLCGSADDNLAAPIEFSQIQMRKTNSREFIFIDRSIYSYNILFICIDIISANAQFLMFNITYHDITFLSPSIYRI